jgi:FkbM family methyltransferase
MFEPAIFPSEAEPALTAEFFKGTTAGFFVDVGANDPVAYSQSYDLEQRGWNGILVEPLPAMAKELRARRKAQVYEVACSSPADEGKPLTFHVAGIFSTLETQSVAVGAVRTGRITVQGATLDSVLRSANAPTPIDYVSIDVEGHEIAVLEGFDLGHWRPRLLVVEDLAMNFALHRYLKARGYVWFRRAGLNAWFAPSDAPPPVGLFGRWQFVRKHYLSLPFRHAREIKRRIVGRPLGDPPKPPSRDGRNDEPS